MALTPISSARCSHPGERRQQTSVREAMAQDVQREFAARAGAGAGVGDLAFADEAVAVAQADLERLGRAWPLAPSTRTR
jgi:hypothetical protein